MSDIVFTPKRGKALGVAHSIMEESGTAFAGIVLSALLRGPGPVPTGFRQYLESHSGYEVDGDIVLAHHAPFGPHPIVFNYLDSLIPCEHEEDLEDELEQQVDRLLAQTLMDVFGTTCQNDALVAFMIEHLPADLDLPVAQAVFDCFDLRKFDPSEDPATFSAIRACPSSAFMLVCSQNGIPGQDA